MPGKYYRRIAAEDNCTYLWDHEKLKWQKLYDVDTRDLPRSVRDGVKDDVKNEAAELALLKSIKI